MNQDGHLLLNFTSLLFIKEVEHEHYFVYFLQVDQLDLLHHTLRILLHHHNPALAISQSSSYFDYSLN